MPVYGDFGYPDAYTIELAQRFVVPDDGRTYRLESVVTAPWLDEGPPGPLTLSVVKSIHDEKLTNNTSTKDEPDMSQIVAVGAIDDLPTWIFPAPSVVHFSAQVLQSGVYWVVVHAESGLVEMAPAADDCSPATTGQPTVFANRSFSSTGTLLIDWDSTESENLCGMALRVTASY
jgi:hypothetical protein